MSSASRAVQFILHAQDFPGVDVDVRGLALETAQRLVDHDPEWLRLKRLPFSPAASRNAPMEAAWPTQMVETGALM